MITKNKANKRKEGSEESVSLLWEYWFPQSSVHSKVTERVVFEYGITEFMWDEIIWCLENPAYIWTNPFAMLGSFWLLGKDGKNTSYIGCVGEFEVFI